MTQDEADDELLIALLDVLADDDALPAEHVEAAAELRRVLSRVLERVTRERAAWLAGDEEPAA